MQIYDKKQNFPKNITRQKLYQQISERKKKYKNRATNYRYQYRGINSLGQPYE